VHRTLAVRARDGHGRLRFRPAYGPGGPRRIVAIVEQNGMPRTEITVARYRAEPPPRLRRPRNVRLRRRGARVSVTWAPVAAAAGYQAFVETPDGRSIRYDVKPGDPRRFTIKRLLSRRGVSVRVCALKRNGMPGPMAKAKGGKAKAKKKPKRGRR
jgi:hypothetical protein